MLGLKEEKSKENKTENQVVLEKTYEITSHPSLQTGVSDRMDFSVVMPVHNEADLLPLSLPSVYRLVPSEIIIIFDNCSDDSEEVAEKIISKYDPKAQITRTINNVPKEIEYNYRIAYLKRLGMDLASYDIVLIADADIILDPKIHKLMPQITRFPFMSFEHVDFPVNWRTRIKSVLRFIPLWTEDKLSGVYAVDLNVKKECEDPEKVKTIEQGEDTLMQRSIRTKYPTNFFHVNNIHLRPKEDSARHYRRGVYYWKTAKRGFLKTILSAIISGRYNLIRGYIHARFGGK
jgi:glycosyltransferase involved in cell wall biosynthesis